MARGLSFRHDGTEDYLRWAGAIDVENLNISNDLVFDTNGGGLQFAGLWTHTQDTITSESQNDWDQITTFTEAADYNGATPFVVNSDIVIAKDGKYFVSFDMAYSTVQAHTIDLHVAKNNRETAFNNISSVRKTSANAIGSVSASGIVDLAQGDTIELWVQRTTAGSNIVITIEKVNLKLFQIGG